MCAYTLKSCLCSSTRCKLPFSHDFYFIIAIDKLTKWVEVALIVNQSALTIAKFILNNIILKYGYLQQILTDNSINFTASILPLLNKLMSIGIHITTLYKPQENGIVECANGILMKILRKLITETGYNWDILAQLAIFSYNIAFHLLMQFSLFKMLYERKLAMLFLVYPLITS